MTGPPTYAIAVSETRLDSKLLPGDARWAQFNASFRNLSTTQNDLMEAIYCGQSITTHHKDRWRTTENYLRGQHIGLDFDSGESTLDILKKDKFISKYAGLIHTTISHTDEHPRSRVIFLLDAPIMQAKNYSMAARSLLWLFDTADRQCKDPVRFFYGSPYCQFEYLDNVLPLDVVQKLIRNYVESGHAEKKRAIRPNYLPPASQQEVADALKRIPPWVIDYDEWVAVLMAIHSEFGEAGYQLAENWADGKQGEVNQKWRSFKMVGNGTGRIGIGTLFALAQRFGWRKADA